MEQEVGKHEKTLDKHKKKHKNKRVYNIVVTCLIFIMLAGQAACVYRIDQLYGMRVREHMHNASQVFTSCIDRVAEDVTMSSEGAVDDFDAMIDENRWQGPVLSKGRGVIYGPSGKETYYNLNMSIIVNMMHRMGYDYEYWVRDDGVKMLGDYVMVAANLNLRPRGSIVMTSLGPGIVCDTGGFAKRNPTQIDIATTW